MANEIMIGSFDLGLSVIASPPSSIVIPRV
jgi:hypothetical protein